MLFLLTKLTLLVYAMLGVDTLLAWHFANSRDITITSLQFW